MLGQKTVCIIGGGVSGLIALKVFLYDSDLFKVILLEQSEHIGGVWSPSKAYVNLTTDSPKYTYGFSELQTPDHFDEFPTAQQMQEYFRMYAEKYKLMDKIELNTKVIKAEEIQDNSGTKWKITAQKPGEGTKSIQCDFLVVASGLMNNPFIPKIENMAKFSGKIYHSSEVLNEAMIRDKKVLIVGSGKSAADLATTCAQKSKSVKMIVRKAHWLVPRFQNKSKTISTRYSGYSRALAACTPYYDLSWKDQLFQANCKFFLDWVLKKAQRDALKAAKLPDNHILKPDVPIVSDPSIGTAPEGFFDAVLCGDITVAKTTIKKFVPNSHTVEFEDGTSENFDVVITGTGYAQQFPFFSEETCKELGIPTYNKIGERQQPFRLYRNMVPLREKRNIGFIGFTSVISLASVSEVQAHWLTDYFIDKLELPSLREMEATVERRLKYEKEHNDIKEPVGFIDFMPHHIIEAMLSDMHLNRPRTTNFIQEYFFPHYPARLSSLQEEKQALRISPLLQLKPFYFSFTHFLFLFAIFCWAMYSTFCN